MVQAEWADKLGTSRMPVRDAFLRLQSEGILTAADKGAAMVALLSEQDIRDAYELNAFAASIAAQRAALNMTRTSADALESIHAKFACAVENGDVARALDTNHGFHRLVNLQSNSPRLVSVLKLLSASLPHVGTRTLPSWRARSVESHALILEALLEGSRGAERARGLMQSHIMEAADVVVAHLRKRGFWSD